MNISHTPTALLRRGIQSFHERNYAEALAHLESCVVEPDLTDGEFTTACIFLGLVLTVSRLDDAPPSVYEEATEMASCAMMIYTFADLRKAIVDGPLHHLELPARFEAIVGAIRDNSDALEAWSNVERSDRKDRLEAFRAVQAANEVSSFWASFDAELTHFEDLSDEIVHGIVVSRSRKRITVVFRGTTTKRDICQDLKCWLTYLENPDETAAFSQIGLHTGFYEYLFKIGEGETRFSSLLRDVMDLVQQRQLQDYQLFVTGHSLGGALATIFAFFAACEREIQVGTILKLPIVVQSIASPFVGDRHFLTSFGDLECRGFLRHARIANKEDIFTFPPFSFGIGFYKHCGIGLRLGGDPTFSLVHPSDTRNDESWSKSFYHLGKAGLFHSCNEYQRRLCCSKHFFTTFTLENLYRDRLPPLIEGDSIPSD